MRDWLLFEIERNAAANKSENEAASVEDPGILFDPVFEEITARIQEHERATHCTWGEIMAAVKAADPDMMQAYRTAYAAVDCDIYGRWLEHAITQRDLENFKNDLKAWRRAADDVLALHAQIHQLHHA